MSRVNLNNLVNLEEIALNTQVQQSPVEYSEQRFIGGAVEIGRPQAIVSSYLAPDPTAAMFNSLAEIASGVQQGLGNYDSIRKNIESKRIEDAKIKFDEIANREDLEAYQKEDSLQEYLKNVSTPYLGRSWVDAINNNAQKFWKSSQARSDYYTNDYKQWVAFELSKNPDLVLTPEVENDLLLKYWGQKPLARSIPGLVFEYEKNKGDIEKNLTDSAIKSASTIFDLQVTPPAPQLIERMANGSLNEDEIQQLRAANPFYFSVQDRISKAGPGLTRERISDIIVDEFNTTVLQDFFKSRPDITPDTQEDIYELVTNLANREAANYETLFIVKNYAERTQIAGNNIAIAKQSASSPSEFLIATGRNLGNASREVKDIVIENLVNDSYSIAVTKNPYVGLEDNGRQLRFLDLSVGEQITYLKTEIEKSKQTFIDNLPSYINQKQFEDTIDFQIKMLVQTNQAIGGRIQGDLTSFESRSINIQQAIPGLEDLDQVTESLAKNSFFLEKRLLGSADASNPVLMRIIQERTEVKNKDGTTSTKLVFKHDKTHLEFADELARDNPEVFKRLNELGFFNEEGRMFYEVQKSMVGVVVDAQREALQRLRIEQRNAEEQAKAQEKYREEIQKSRDDFSYAINKFRFQSGSSGTGKDFEFLITSGTFESSREDQVSWNMVTEGYAIVKELEQIDRQIETTTNPAEKQGLEQAQKGLQVKLGNLTNKAGFETNSEGQPVPLLVGVLNEVHKSVALLTTRLYKLNLIQVDDQGQIRPYSLTPEDGLRLAARLEQEVLYSLSGSQQVIKANPETPINNPFNPKTGTLTDDAIVQLVKLDASIDAASRFQDNYGKIGTMFNGTLTRLGSRRGILNTPDSYYDLLLLRTMSVGLKDITLRTGTVPLIHDGEFFRQYALIFGNVLDNLSFQETMQELRNPKNPSAAYVVPPTQVGSLYAASVENREPNARGNIIVNRGAWGFENVVSLNIGTLDVLSSIFNQAVIPEDLNNPDVNLQPSFTVVDDDAWDPNRIAHGLTRFLGEPVSNKVLALKLKQSYLDSTGIDLSNLPDDQVIRLGIKAMIELSRPTDAIVRATQFLESREFGFERFAQINPNASKLDIWLGVIGAFSDTDITLRETPGLVKNGFIGPIKVIETGTEDAPIQELRLQSILPGYSVPGNGSLQSFNLRMANDLRKMPVVKENIEALKTTYPPETDAAIPSTSYILGASVLNLEPTPKVIAAAFNLMFLELEMQVETEKQNQVGLFFNFSPGPNDPERQVLSESLAVASNAKPKTLGEFLIIADKEYRRLSNNTDSMLTDDFKGWQIKGAAEVVQEPGYTNLNFLPSWRFVTRNQSGIPRIAINDVLINYVGGR